jgi:hypothetical protein
MLLAYVLELIANDLSLQAQLQIIVHMLPLTAATQPEMFTGRGHTVLRGFYDFYEVASRIALAFLPQFDAHRLARDAKGNEHDFSLMSTHGISTMGNAGQLQDDSGQGFPFHIKGLLDTLLR